MAKTTKRSKRSTPRSRKAGKPPSRRRPRPKQRRLTKGFEVIRWIETHCVFTNGEWIGKPFRLLPWQKRLILALFEVDPETRLRRYRWALVGVPKKNGKTELAAALALYFLIGDGEPSALVVCAAASDEQADLVFGAAKTMAEMSPTLKQVCEPYDREILVPSLPGAKLVRVAAAAGTNDGKNIHAVICDELHEWLGQKGERVWTVLTNGLGARRQPMVLQITTAGFDRGSICYRQYEHGVKVRDGREDDPTFFFHWQQASDKMDYRDPKTWAAANPSYGVTVQDSFFRDQLKRKPENVFRRYFLNQWTGTEVGFIPMDRWDAGAGKTKLGEERAPVVVGIDAAPKHDSTAITIGMKDAEGLIHTKTRIMRADPSTGLLDFDQLENLIRSIAREYDLVECRFDPYHMTRSAITLGGEGIPMIEFPQTDVRMVPASQALFDAVVEGRLLHEGDPEVRAQIEAAAAKETSRGWRLHKMKSSGSIDSSISHAMVVDRLENGEPLTGEPQIYVYG